MLAYERFHFSPFAAEDEKIVKISQLSDSMNV